MFTWSSRVSEVDPAEEYGCGPPICIRALINWAIIGIPLATNQLFKLPNIRDSIQLTWLKFLMH